MLDFIEDEIILKAGVELNQLHEDKNQEHRQDKVSSTFQKKSVKGFIRYSQGGYFGDSDIFGCYISAEAKKSRDSTAITSIESVLFSMPEHIIIKIKDNFESKFQEMK